MALTFESKQGVVFPPFGDKGSVMKHILFPAVLGLMLILNPCLQAEKESPLEETMSGMGKAFKQLGKALEDPTGGDQANNLKLVEIIKKGATQAREQVPDSILKMPVTEQPENILLFKKQMDHLLQSLDDLGKALQAGKLDESRTAYAAVKKAKAMGHEQFVKEEEKKK